MARGGTSAKRCLGMKSELVHRVDAYTIQAQQSSSITMKQQYESIYIAQSGIIVQKVGETKQDSKYRDK